MKKSLKERLSQNTYTRKLLDYDFRTICFTVVSLVITLGYAALYATLGIAFLSLWYGMLACYYIMIVVMRATVVFYHRKKRGTVENANAYAYKEKISRAKIYKYCGIVIACLTFPLSLAIMQMVARNATFSHAGLMIYASATYTAYRVVMTIRNYFKARKSDDLTVRCARDINLADTAVSVLALQTAMFNSFSPKDNWSVFNAVTGAAVCFVTVVIGALMIAGGKRAITKINYEFNLQKTKEHNEDKK